MDVLECELCITIEISTNFATFSSVYQHAICCRPFLPRDSEIYDALDDSKKWHGTLHNEQTSTRGGSSVAKHFGVRSYIFLWGSLTTRSDALPESPGPHKAYLEAS